MSLGLGRANAPTSTAPVRIEVTLWTARKACVYDATTARPSTRTFASAWPSNSKNDGATRIIDCRGARNGRSSCVVSVTSAALSRSASPMVRSQRHCSFDTTQYRKRASDTKNEAVSCRSRVTPLGRGASPTNKLRGPATDSHLLNRRPSVCLNDASNYARGSA